MPHIRKSSEFIGNMVCDVICDQHIISNRLIYCTTIFGKFSQNWRFPP